MKKLVKSSFNIIIFFSLFSCVIQTSEGAKSGMLRKAMQERRADRARFLPNTAVVTTHIDAAKDIIDDATRTAEQESFIKSLRDLPQSITIIDPKSILGCSVEEYTVLMQQRHDSISDQPVRELYEQAIAYVGIWNNYKEAKEIEEKAQLEVQRNPKIVLGYSPSGYEVLMARRCVETSYAPAKDLFFRALMMVRNEDYYEAKNAEKAAEIALQNMPQALEAAREKEVLIEEISKIYRDKDCPESVKRYLVPDPYSDDPSQNKLAFIYAGAYPNKQLKYILNHTEQLKLIEEIREIYSDENCPQGVINYLLQPSISGHNATSTPIYNNESNILADVHAGKYSNKLLNSILAHIQSMVMQAIISNEQ